MSDFDRDLLPGIRRDFEAQRWEVSVSQLDDHLHVSVHRGLMGAEGVRLNRYPRSERGARRAVRFMQRWCDRQNAKLDRGAALLEKFEAQR